MNSLYIVDNEKLEIIYSSIGQHIPKLFKYLMTQCRYSV